MLECGLVIRFESGTAHGDETVSHRAIFLNIVEIGRVIGRRGVLAVYAPGRQLCAGIQDHIFRRMDKEDTIFMCIMNLTVPKRKENSDFIAGRFRNRSGIQCPGCGKKDLSMQRRRRRG